MRILSARSACTRAMNVGQEMHTYIRKIPSFNSLVWSSLTLAPIMLCCTAHMKLSNYAQNVLNCAQMTILCTWKQYSINLHWTKELFYCSGAWEKVEYSQQAKHLEMNQTNSEAMRKLILQLQKVTAQVGSFQQQQTNMVSLWSVSSTTGEASFSKSVADYSLGW